MEYLPTLVLLRITEYLSLLDILNFRLTSSINFDVCEETHFKRLTDFNTIVLFRRSFVQIDDFFSLLECNKALFQSNLFGKFELCTCKTSTISFLKWEDKIFNLGHNFEIATYLSTTVRNFLYFDVEGTINNCSVLAVNCSNLWMIFIMNQDHKIEINLKYIFHHVQILSMVSFIQPPKTIVSRLSSVVIYINKHKKYYLLENKSPDTEKTHHMHLTQFNHAGDTLKTCKFSNRLNNKTGVISVQNVQNPVVGTTNYFPIIISFVFNDVDDSFIFCEIRIKQQDVYQMIVIQNHEPFNKLVYFALHNIDGRGLPANEMMIYSFHIQTKTFKRYHTVSYSSELKLYDDYTLKSGKQTKFIHLNHSVSSEVSMDHLLDVKVEHM